MKLSVVTQTPAQLPEGLNLMDPAFHAHGDPHAAWATMRAHHPAHLQELPDGRRFWSVTRYADVDDVLRDHTRFTSTRGTLLSILGTRDPAGNKMMAATDPPRHRDMREPLNKALSARALASREPDIRRLVRGLIAPLLTGEEWDLAEAAAVFPMAFTGALMGLPERDWAELVRLTTTSIAPSDADFVDSSPDDTLAAAHHSLFEYFSRVVADRVEPGDDLLGYLLEMEAGGAQLRYDEVVYNCYSLLLGANVTTPHAFAGTVLGMIADPAQWARIRKDRDLVQTAVEEGLRWSSPANHFMRYTTEATEIEGTRIPAGEAVVAWLGSANRDDRVFADPYRFDVGRRPNRHVAFGFGPHFCVGAPLARLALRVLVEELVDAVEEWESTGPVTHLCSNFVAGVKSFPVRASVSRDAEPVRTPVLQAGGVR